MAYIQASLDAILPLIVNKLIADGLFNENTCFLGCADDRPYYPPADQYCVVVAGGASTWDPAEVGGGRQVTILDQEVRVTLWNRYGLDVAGRSPIMLTNFARGILRKEFTIMNSLQEYFPQDEDGNIYSAEGLRLSRQDEAVREVGNEEWGRRRTFWKLNYQPPITYLNPPV